MTQLPDTFYMKYSEDAVFILGLLEVAHLKNGVSKERANTIGVYDFHIPNKRWQYLSASVEEDTAGFYKEVEIEELREQLYSKDVLIPQLFN